MVAAAYTSDLTDIFLFESTGGVSAYGGGASGLGASPDYAIEGTNAVDKQVSAAEKGFLYDNVTNFSIGADDHFFIWCIVGVPGLVDTRDNRGIVVNIGDSTSAFVKFHVNGGDTIPKGGHNPYAIRFDNTSLANRRTLVGSPSAAPSQIGVGANITGSAKFSNLGGDAARIGTGYDILNGTGADPEADFAGIASDDESTAEGIFQTADGGFKLQGKLRIGSATTACELLDQNTNIFIIDTLHSLTDFSEILIEHASSIFTLTNVNFIALGTNNPGRLEMLTAAANLAFNNVGFIGWGATVLGSGATMTGCRWVGCDQITAGAATFIDSTFSGYEGTANTSYMIWNDAVDPNGELDGTVFTKGVAATHAIEFGTSSPLTMTLTDVTFSGYNAADGQNDSAIHFKRTTGTVNLTISGGTTPSYRTDGATINIISGAVTVAVKAQEPDGTAIQNARVILHASDGTGPFPFEETVTITRAGAVATVSHTSHGMATNDKVMINGADQPEYNGVFQITVTGANSYTYTVSGTPATPATGTIDATFVALEGLTDINGDISTTRVYATDQPVVGRARKSSSSPFFKTADIVGTVDNVDGISATAVMISDE
ncbi:MAG: hypothetical protein KAJ19_14065 [Gammaproteobacteria bacterium]|nr:hypothetical protein [Gammaproteobacteria bacterium]